VTCTGPSFPRYVTAAIQRKCHCVFCSAWNDSVEDGARTNPGDHFVFAQVFGNNTVTRFDVHFRRRVLQLPHDKDGTRIVFNNKFRGVNCCVRILVSSWRLNRQFHPFAWHDRPCRLSAKREVKMLAGLGVRRYESSVSGGNSHIFQCHLCSQAHRFAYVSTIGRVL